MQIRKQGGKKNTREKKRNRHFGKVSKSNKWPPPCRAAAVSTFLGASIWCWELARSTSFPALLQLKLYMPGAASLQIVLDNPLQKLLPLKLPAVLELNLFLAEFCTSWHLENKDSPMGLLWKDSLGTASVTPGRMEPLEEGRGKGFELRFTEGSSRRDLLLPTSHLQSVPSPARKGLSQDLPPVVTLAKIFSKHFSQAFGLFTNNISIASNYSHVKEPPDRCLKSRGSNQQIEMGF